jgi:N-acetylmuramoyl-L-alanine amidase
MTRDKYRARTATISTSRHPRRFVWRGLLAGVLICGFLTLPLSATSLARKKELARQYFETAERLHEALNGRPVAERKIHDYQRVIDAYRKVYYIAPSSPKAPDAVFAVAELLADKGRQFKNEATLKDAIGQYEFLRKEYPGSRQRLEALFTIAQIYKDDLHDKENARATFQEYLKHYPHSKLAADARKEMKDLEDSKTELAAKLKPEPAKTESKTEPRIEKPVEAKAADTDSGSNGEKEESTKTTLVTGVRHWSTPDYTRIAIDLKDDVKFASYRISHPDRIYFDLEDARVPSALNGKSFDVDDGFLKKIRVAQFAPGTTRVVLEVGDDVGDYSAFLLPNPSRLIIDVHGKKQTKVMARTKVSNATHVKEEDSEKESKLSTVPAETAVKKGPESDKSAKSTPPATSPKATKEKAEAAKAVETKESPKSEPITVAKNEAPSKITDVEPEPETRKPASKARSREPKAKNELPLRVRGKKRQPPEMIDVHTAQPTMDGDRSLVRALGLKIGRIVVDAGHGGHDTGTIGPHGLYEKDVVLDVALRLGKLLESRLGADVVYTRDDDTFVPLETRTAIANQQQADLFISIHANSSHDPSARGVETYYLNFTTSRDALEVAARENAVSDKSIHELQDLVKTIALKDKIEESREFAIDVQNALYSGIGAGIPAIRDRGVKKAPFIVLIGANMPSILAEISFISNPTDEKKLETAVYRQKIAESIYKGVAKYVGGLSGIKVAQKMARDEGQ